MKPICFAAALVVFVAGCASTSSPTNEPAARPAQAAPDTYLLHSPDNMTPGDATSRPPRLTVGTSYSDTQLILPWFLNDVIDFINYR